MQSISVDEYNEIKKLKAFYKEDHGSYNASIYPTENSVIKIIENKTGNTLNYVKELENALYFGNLGIGVKVLRIFDVKGVINKIYGIEMAKYKMDVCDFISSTNDENIIKQTVSKMADLVDKFNKTHSHTDVKAMNFVCNDENDVKMIDFDPYFIKKETSQNKHIISLIQLALSIYFCINTTKKGDLYTNNKSKISINKVYFVLEPILIKLEKYTDEQIEQALKIEKHVTLARYCNMFSLNEIDCSDKSILNFVRKIEQSPSFPMSRSFMVLLLFIAGIGVYIYNKPSVSRSKRSKIKKIKKRSKKDIKKDIKK